MRLPTQLAEHPEAGCRALQVTACLRLHTVRHTSNKQADSTGGCMASPGAAPAAHANSHTAAMRHAHQRSNDTHITTACGSAGTLPAQCNACFSSSMYVICCASVRRHDSLSLTHATKAWIPLSVAKYCGKLSTHISRKPSHRSKLAAKPG